MTNPIEKYSPLSPYLWCAGNPIYLVDQTGMDGMVAIKGNTISISANVYLYGDGATNIVRDIYQNGVDEKWSNREYFINHNNNIFVTTINAHFLLYDNKEKNSPFIIIEKFDPTNRDNFIEVVNSDKITSEVVGFDEGKWRGKGRLGKSLDQDNPAPHEFGHILGLRDRYDKVTKKPYRGWELNIMGSSKDGNVELRNIEQILNDVFIKYDDWIKDHNPDKETFIYEINP